MAVRKRIGANEREQLAARINRLQRKNRSLRQWTAVEFTAMTVLIVAGIAFAGWLAFRGDAGQPIGTAPITGTEPRGGYLDPPSANENAVRHPARPIERSRAAASAREPVSTLDISIEHAVVTNAVMTEFFGVPATDPEPALVLSIRVANTDLDREAVYRTLRDGGAGIADDHQRMYASLDYGRIPIGGVSETTIDPGGVIDDVLIFEAPPRDVGHVELMIAAKRTGGRARSIRIPIALVEFPAAEVPVGRARPAPTGEDVPRTRSATPKATDPAPPRTPEPAEVDVQALRQAAEAGDPDGLWRLGCAYREGTGVPRDAKEAFGHIRKAAGQGHPDAMLAAARMLRDGEGARPDRRLAVRWLQKLVKTGSLEAHQELAALDAPAYVRVAKELSARNLDVLAEPGIAVKTRGRLSSTDGDGSWRLTMDSGRAVAADLSRVRDPHVAIGMYARIGGIVTPEGTIDVLLAEIPEATVNATTRVRPPTGGVVANRRTLYTIECTIENTGVQPIKSVVVNVRIRVRSTMSATRPVAVYDLRPGAKRLVTTEAEMYNPGFTSVPVADITDLVIDW